MIKNQHKEASKSVDIIRSQCTLGDQDAHRDGRMNEVFAKTDHYHKLLTDSSSFIVGRRGAGKSALALHMKEQFDECRVFTDEGANYDRYKSVIATLAEQYGLTDDQARDAAYDLWRFVLIVSLLDVCSGSLGDNKTLQANIREYLDSREFRVDDLGDIITWAQQFAVDGIDGYGEQTEILNRLRGLSGSEAELQMLTEVGRTKKLSIGVFFDSLERYELDNSTMVAALQGIARATLSFCEDLGLSDVFRVYFSMPGEVFEDVARIAPGKIYPKSIFVTWSYGELISFLALRYIEMMELARVPHDSREIDAIKKKIDRSNELNTMGREVRDDFFYALEILPRKVENRRGDAEDTFAYIFRHTQLRPRELITVFNRMLKVSLSKKELPNISSTTVVDVIHEPAIMQNLVRDALSPFEDIHRDFADVTRDVLYGEPRVFRGAKLVKYSKRIWDQAPMGNTVTPNQFLKYLLRSGVVGQVPDADSHAYYTSASFEYLVQDRVPFSSDRLYCVHPIVGDFYEMPAAPSYGPVYPVTEHDVLFGV